MSNYELSLSECCRNLTSPKVTVKKKGLTELEILLSNDECCKLLNDNHERNRGSVKWDSLYQAVHTALLKEVERMDGVNALVKLLGGILPNVVSKANSGEPKLTGGDVISTVLDAFENNSLRRSLPEPYLQILFLILPEKAYWSQIKRTTWEDLLKFCVRIFGESSNEMRQQKSLIALNSVIEHGCKYSGFYHTARKLLDFASDIIQSMDRKNRHLQDALRLSLILCAQLRKEYRLSVCRFGEAIFPYLIDLPRETFTKWEVLPELLDAIIRIHHPCSVQDVDSGAVSICSFEDWLKSLKSLYNSIQVVIDDFGDEETAQKKKIIELAATIAKLIFKETESDSIDYSFFDEPACKKRRLIHHSISSIIEGIRFKKNSVSQWPWLAFMESVMTNHPQTMKEGDLSNLLEHVNEQLHSPPSNLVTKYLYRCATWIAILESKIEITNRTADIWSGVWVSLMSKLQFLDNRVHSNDLQILLRTLFKFKKISKDHVMSFTALFVEGKLNFNVDSLTTLLVLAESGALADLVDTRVSLVNILVKGRALEDPATVAVFSRLVFSLILKSKCAGISGKKRLWPEDEIFLIESTLLTPPSFETVDEEMKDAVLECSAASKTLVELLLDLRNDFELNQDPVTLIHHGAFLLHLSSLTGRNGHSSFSNLQNLLRYTLDRVTTSLRSQFQLELTSVKQIMPSVHVYALNLIQYPSQLMGLKHPDIINGLFQFVYHSFTVKRASVSNEFPSLPSAKEAIVSLEERQAVETLIIAGEYLKLANFFQRPAIIGSSKGFALSMSIIDFVTTLRAHHFNYETAETVASLLFEASKIWLGHFEESLSVISSVAKVWDASARLSIPFGRWSALLCKTLGEYFKLIEERKYGVRHHAALLETFGKMIQMDKLCELTVSSKNPIGLHPSLHLVSFLDSQCYELRFACTTILPIAFHGEDAEIQSEVFNKALEAAENLFTISVEEDLTSAEVEEEGAKIACSSMSILVSLIASSAVNRRRTLFNFFRIVVIKNIDFTLIRRALNLIEVKLKLDVTTFLEQNLDFICYMWYKKNGDFENFPFKILGSPSLTLFLREYKTCLVPIFLDSVDVKGLDSFCRKIETDQASLFKDCFPEVMSCFLTVAKSNAPKGDVMSKIIERALGSIAMSQMLSEDLDKVLACVFQKLHDSSHFFSLCQADFVVLPERSPMHVTFSEIESALSYLQQSKEDPKESFLSSLSVEGPYLLHLLIHALASNIAEACTIEIKTLCLHHFLALCDCITTEVDQIGSMKGYFVRSVVHTLLRVSKTELVVPSLKYLARFLRRCMSECSEIVNVLLEKIVPSLLSIVVCDGAAGINEALSLLDLLLVENKSSLPGVKELGPLPEHPRVIHLKSFEDCEELELEDEIKKFLKISRASDDSFKGQALKHLLSQLQGKQSDLNSLYAQLKENKGLVVSLLHQLIVALVNLTQNSSPNISESAAKCLGELGPRDLTTLVLKPESGGQSIPLVDSVFEMLIPLLVNDDVSVAEGAAVALKALLNTKEGVQGKGRLDKITQSFVSPFVSLSSKPRRPYSVEMASDDLISVLKEFLCPADEFTSYDSWIRSLVANILICFVETNSFLRGLSPIAEFQLNVAEILIPYLAYIILAKKDSSSKVFEEQLNSFFLKHYKEVNKESIFLNRASVSCMLNVVQFYRQTSFIEKDQVTLELNYYHVARAAHFCRAYFTGIFYLELWADELLHGSDHKGNTDMDSPLDAIDQLSKETGSLLRNYLWDGYKEIGETDAAHGCGAAFAVEPSERIKYLSQMELWSQVIEFCEIMGDPSYKPDLMHALRMSGMYKTACEASLDQTEYECAWRLADWSHDLPQEDNDFSKLHYGVLKSLTQGDDLTAKLYLKKARKAVTATLDNVSLEVARSVYQPLSRLRVLREIEKLKLEKCEVQAEECENFKLKNDLKIEEHGRWVDMEPILHQRSLLVDQSLAPDVLFEATAQARKAQSHLVARRFLAKIDELVENPSETKLRVQLERAEILWKSGDSCMAKHLLKQLINSPESVGKGILTRGLLTYGTWMNETKSESPSKIIEDYFKKADEICPEPLRSSVANAIAKLADSEYQRIQQYMKSSEYRAKVQMLDEIEKQKAQLDKMVSSGDEDLAKMKGICNAQREIHKKENSRLQNERDFFLKLAISQYLRSLMLSEDEFNDLNIFRFVSLWLENQAHPQLHDLSESLLKMPSSKFLRVLPQLAGHLSDDVSHFSRTLRSVFQRCCDDHPHHALWLILAQKNSNRDNLYLKNTGRNDDGSRVKAAKLIENELAKSDTRLLARKMQQLSEAYVSLAYYLVGEKVRPGPKDIPSRELIKKLNNLTDIHCITAPLAVDKNKCYDRITGIVKFEDKFTFVGGLNAPKKIVCLCTDGVKRVQLVKGKDDSRQDAVMQQVFGIVNSLLKNDEDTRKRRLLLRTYKVVPLSRKSGVIEWVDNTELFGGYLLEAHPTFRPQDMKPSWAREVMGKVVKGSYEERFESYSYVCTRLKPVFRYFFYRKFFTPTEWLDRRLAYTRSVASNSMTGYILGIGDRHVANILIDLVTAEIIHIDFGICFEQGRSLPTPETVPFRLTRDVVDGMGTSGVEGVFRRSCEETLRVLRKYHEPILTSLEVLLYDPLTVWTVSHKKAMTVQSDLQYPTLDLSTLQGTGEDKAKTNTLGECALHRLKQKLEGRHEGPSLGVEAHVDLLINLARDPRNLCAQYYGWQAYL